MPRIVGNKGIIIMNAKSGDEYISIFGISICPSFLHLLGNRCNYDTIVFTNCFFDVFYNCGISFEIERNNV